MCVCVHACVHMCLCVYAFDNHYGKGNLSLAIFVCVLMPNQLFAQCFCLHFLISASKPFGNYHILCPISRAWSFMCLNI